MNSDESKMTFSSCYCIGLLSLSNSGPLLTVHSQELKLGGLESAVLSSVFMIILSSLTYCLVGL